MDLSKVGNLIYNLRKEKGMTQKQMANIMNISDKTISKWERGLGCPDVSLLPELSSLLGVNIEKILLGELNPNEQFGGNMKNLKFYVCPECINIITSTGTASISCCGRKLEELEPVKVDENHALSVENSEYEWFITTNHPMTKDHYISFVAYVTGDKLLMAKQYPEWPVQLYFQKFGHGILYIYCTKHGLSYQLI
ncbi:helix-turn-helix domain-containing protein [Acetivibrio clariflavus]|uniref:Putative transcriptional regulator n=1 Tax=Acetivibrio clariflavus (strain DSM 19732 / NBRC 101661 / EBR45) TaxID=720554 RepID=G8LXK4_ACECE|nr:helix-turn-helix domain-containing protein [Acetivibrio clariflavus]AEV67715.1 putative transcriptional regulator [Acetivibrio clariflavus DSM 19732]